MDPKLRTPIEIFTLPQRLVVPLFQRAYVWSEDAQWQPLWDDMRRVAEYGLRSDRRLTHFLGAVVIQDAEKSFGDISEWSVIDGQQRLTTLQIFFDAAAGVFESRAMGNLAQRLAKLTHNDAVFAEDLEEADDDSPLKLVHANRDREAFQEVMLAEVPVDYSSLRNRNSRIAHAHRFFTERISAWLDEGSPDDVSPRAKLLVESLTRSLQLVVISLKADENSQEIFETLNARGTPLTAADLIKNFVLQELRRGGGDVNRAYTELWPFESDFWEKEVSAGRYKITRSSLFLNQWLISRTGEEVGPTATFTRFKSYVLSDEGRTMLDLLRDIRRQADAYESWTRAAADPKADLDAFGLHVYRMDALQLELTKPVLILLTEPGRSYTPADAGQVIAMLESWLVRRALLRLTTSALGRVVADLIARVRGIAEDVTVVVAEQFLRSNEVSSTYWPGDADLAAALATAPINKQQSQKRLRMVLEAIEDWYRGYSGRGHGKSGDRVPRPRTYQIEHILPQNWQAHWPVDSEEAAALRASRIQVLGNLTLLTGSLNASISDSAWLGERGKRVGLQRFDLFLMNRRLHDMSAEGWDENLIDSRSHELVSAILEIWPVPSGHLGEIVDRTEVETRQIAFEDLISAGLLAPGTVLRGRAGMYETLEITVLEDGSVNCRGIVYPSPSAAAWHETGAGRNAWYFWVLPDGRDLNALRSELRPRR
jgi:hypothetical protein